MFVEKTPGHVFFIPHIKALFPEAKIIHIVRDPRDMAVGFRNLLAKQGKPDRSAYEIAQVWLGAVRAARKHGLFTVRYEDLVTDTRRTLDAIGGHIGHPLVVPEPAALQAQARKVIAPGETWKDGVFKAITPQHIGEYMTALSPGDACVLLALCATHMRHYGYATDGSASGFPLRQMLRFNVMRFMDMAKASLSCGMRPLRALGPEQTP